MIPTARSSSSVQTLRWQNDRLELIDQRVLPQTFRYETCDSAESVATAIRNMVIRGAPAIGCAAAYGIALEAQNLKDLPKPAFEAGLSRAFVSLAKSRPTAVNLFWALERMQAAFAKHVALGNRELAEKLLEEAERIRAEDIQNNRRMGEHGAALLSSGSTVLTHCNAGALATAGHGTALGVIRSAVEAGKSISVVADETRPFLQGARLTAWELSADGIPVTLITDSMAGYLMTKGDIQAVIVGADRVAANGDVANKIGTYMVAVLAQRHAIPFYVACPVSTIDPRIPNGAAIPIEERESSEVLGFQGQHWAPPGIAVKNPAFDVTPAELVSALITERGVVTAPNAEKIAKLLAG